MSIFKSKFLDRTASSLSQIRGDQLVMLPILIASDLLAKFKVEQILTEVGASIPIFPGFNFTLGRNRGVSFGILDSSHWVAPYLLSSFAIVLVVFALSWAARQSSKLINFAGILFAAGGLANAIDRLGDGAVTDYLDFGWQALRWPTFNLADILIFIGVVLLLIAWRNGSQNLEGGEQ
ncbi:signal peptidase II [Maricaulis maris]|uniref:signal peptidase II n=1 Tax=Maricaulis maris TaxID=74318 RepID=UPI00292184BC|nr:lipoprotein signal peptidase [Maricaulis maris]